MCSVINTIHKFEAAGLGKAPFRFVGSDRIIYQACHGAPIQPGSSCDYCGNAISNVYYVKSSDGNEFKVGCDCIRKCDDASLIKIVTEEEAKKRRAVNAKRRETNAKKRLDRKASVVAKWEAGQCESLKGQPHPRAQFADKSMFDYIAWMMSNGYVNADIQTIIENA
jgi:hypothetical protein